MSLLIYTTISIVGIFIAGLGLAAQKTSFNIVGLLVLFMGTLLALLAAFIEPLFPGML
ncbi:MAG: hypothetical protein AWU59_817 [Methanolobus sp. T82-4]|nr:MAG: hypothetical protein AWU59_817 [Methanolobus sp. T82-4]